MQVSKVSILGCGWLGQALAKELLGKNITVLGSTTTFEKIEALKQIGIKPFLYSLEKADSVEFSTLVGGAETCTADEFFSSDVLIMTLPTSKISILDEKILGYEKIFQKNEVKRLIYISSTSVYGSTQGVVHESTDPVPDTLAGVRQYEIEKRLSELAKKYKTSLYIVRSAGQIGVNRHPAKFLAGRKNLPDGESPVNMVHQLDLARIVAALSFEIFKQPLGNLEIYNAVAKSHPSKQDFYQRAAFDLGLEAPEFLPLEGSGQVSSKIVVGDKVLEQLGLEMIYDDLFDFFKS